MTSAARPLASVVIDAIGSARSCEGHRAHGAARRRSQLATTHDLVERDPPAHRRARCRDERALDAHLEPRDVAARDLAVHRDLRVRELG
jgi:hypothetical protein